MPEELREKYGNWGEHPDYSLCDWRDEVICDHTRRGYWEWVAAKLDEEAICPKQPEKKP